MNRSSYKYLTVILATLLAATAIGIIILIFLLTGTDGDSPAAVTEGSRPISTQTDRQESTSSENPSDSNPPQTDSTLQTTAKPDESDSAITSGGDQPEVPIGPVSGSAYGDKLGSLELYAEWNTISYDPATGSCTLKLNIYVDSYSLTLGPRFKNYLTINDQQVEFQSEAISIPAGSPKVRTLLYSTEYEVQKDSLTQQLPVHIEFGWHYQGSYSGEHAEWLTLIANFTV